MLETRWLIRRDMPQVMEIESAVNPRPWSEENFIECLRQRNCIGMIASDGDLIEGFILYELRRDFLNVLRIEAVERDAAAALVAKLISKLAYQRRTHFIAHVRESDLAMLFVMREAACRGIAVERQFFGPDEDAVAMEYRLDPGLCPRGWERVNDWESVPIGT